MAQRVLAVRTGFGFGLLRAIARLSTGGWPLRCRQPEETRTGPMCPGHNAGDLGQGCVVLALMLETVRQHQDGVGLTTPGAHELGPWFEANHGNARVPCAVFGIPCERDE